VHLKQSLSVSGCLLLALAGCGRKPLTPAAPWTDVVNDTLYFLATTTDPDGLQLEYLFDWGGSQAFTTRRYQSGETAYIRHSFEDPGWRDIRVRARNENGKSSAWSPSLRFRKSKPPVFGDDSVAGLVRWTVNHWYHASVKVSDPDGDSVAVKFAWDGEEGGTWTALVPSGSTFTDSCMWTTTGPHTVQVVAKDKGNMVARPASAKTVNVSGMAVTWYDLSGEYEYVGTPVLGSIDGEPVLFCLGDVETHCYSLDGRLRWTSATSVSGSPSASLSQDGSRLYYCDDDGLACLDSRTGQRKWLLPLDTIPYAAAECTPALGPNGSIYITINGWYDYELARVKDCGDSAALQWLVDLGEFSPITEGAVVGRNGAIYTVECDEYNCFERLYAFDVTGTVLWIDSTTIPYGGVPVIDSRDRLVIADGDGYLFCFNPDGSLAWSVTTSWLYAGSTAVGPDDELVTIDYFGGLRVFDNAGHEQWSTPLVFEEMNTPCVADDGSIVAYNAGECRVYGVSSDGRLQWEYCVIDSLGIERRPRREDVGYEPSVVIGPNGDLYLAGYLGIFCLSGTNLRMANTAWPTFNHDVARSGWAGRP